MTFSETPEFRKDLRRLCKEYKSLKEDIEILKKIIAFRPEARLPFSYYVDDHLAKERLVNFCKIACKSVKGRGVCSGMHLIYAYFEKEQRVTFIGVYSAPDREGEKKVCSRGFS